MQNKDVQFDVAVIGAGPSGMIAAIIAAQRGARVALIEKNDRAGIKLLMAGNGRCNLTQAEFDPMELTKKYGKNGKFLFGAFQKFGPKTLMEFFASRGIKTKIEKDKRVFPISDQGKDVLEVLLQMLKENGVTFFYKSSVIGFETENNKIIKIITKKKEIIAKRYILAVGGKSYPHTGSAGDGYVWAHKMGHTIKKPRAVLVPIKTIEQWGEKLQGVRVGSVEISAIQNDKKHNSYQGDMLFTHFGISGPAVLNLSCYIEKILEKGEVKLNIDLKPYLSFEQLDEILRKDFEKNASKKLVNCLGDLFSPKLLNFLFLQSGLDMEKHCGKFSKQERQKLVRLFKNLEMTVLELFGFEKAMVTSGGVSIKEIDSKNMQSKIIENLYFAGEIIDMHGPTGGYNLQLCWSTGFLAGKSAARN